jgi:CBS domain-containing protein
MSSPDERSSAVLKARDIMTTEVITVTPDLAIDEVAKLLLTHHINGVPVVDSEGSVIGVICQSDLIVQQKASPVPSVFNLLGGLIPLRSSEEFDREVRKMAAVKAADAMTENPVTVAPNTPLMEVANLMVAKKFHTLPVVEGDKLVGIIGKEDVLRTLLPK